MRKRFWTKRVRILLIVAAVLAVAVTLGAALGQGQDLGFGQNLISSVVTPLRAGVRAIDRQAVMVYDYIYRYETLAAENERLRQELARQNAALDAAETYRRENQRLRELLELEQENEDFSYAAANVITFDTSVWESRLTLDKGTAHGLSAGMCAITGTGQVVGMITEIGTNWCVVSTIFDVSVQISSRVGPYTGVLQSFRQEDGSSSLQLRYLAASAALKTGQRILTAGSERYPGGLLLGTVESSGLDETGVSRYASVSADLTLDGLEQVFIITEHGADNRQ